MKALISAIVLAVVCLASAAAPASADPVQHFENFTINCGDDVYVIVSKPGSSNVVTVNGAPSNSIAILMGFQFIIDGVVVAELHKPYTLKQGERIVICEDRGFPAGILFIAEVKFAPAP